MAAETVDLGYVKGPTGDTGPVGPTGPQGDPATVPTTDLENFQGYIGYNEVESSTATGNECVTLSQLKDFVETVVNAALTDVEAANSFIGNLKKITATVPTMINQTGSGVEAASRRVFSDSGTAGLYFDSIAMLFANLMLAAPNNDHTQVFGYLDDNTTDLSSTGAAVRSSAALTAAYESGGSGEVVKRMVPVRVSSVPSASGSSYSMQLAGENTAESVKLVGYDAMYVVEGPSNGSVAIGTVYVLNSDSTVTLSANESVSVSPGEITVYAPAAGGSGGTSGLRLVKEGSISYLYDGDEPVPVMRLKGSSGYPVVALSGETINGSLGDNLGGFSINGNGHMTLFSNKDTYVTLIFDNEGNPVISTSQPAEGGKLTADDLTNVKKYGDLIYLDSQSS